MDELHRHTVWQSNKKYMEVHNENADKHGFTLGMNEFADLETHEFAEVYNGYLMSERNVTSEFTVTGLEVPSQVDWRQQGYVTGIKNQGQCGSCWSFSATGSLEGQWFKKTGRLISLSEQNLCDCSRNYGNHGCKGGLMDAAFRYIAANKGIDTESSYPYLARDERTCRYTAANKGAEDSTYRDISRGNENALMEAAGSIGPISVAIDASHRSFQMYRSGVYYERECSSSRLDHGVLVVGYGTYGGQAYWLVKNSWGTNWGMNGYIMMARNRQNNCGIATQASYPIV